MHSGNLRVYFNSRRLALCVCVCGWGVGVGPQRNKFFALSSALELQFGEEAFNCIEDSNESVIMHCDQVGDQ